MSKIVKPFTKISDQRERAKVKRAVARIGWRPCRPVRKRSLGRAVLQVFILPTPDSGTTILLLSTVVPFQTVHAISIRSAVPRAWILPQLPSGQTLAIDGNETLRAEILEPRQDWDR